MNQPPDLTDPRALAVSGQDRRCTRWPRLRHAAGRLPRRVAPTTTGAVPLYGPHYQTRTLSQLYREMRRQHGPVVPVMLEGDIPAWLAIGYRQLHQVLSDPSFQP